jgi:putative polymerase
MSAVRISFSPIRDRWEPVDPADMRPARRGMSTGTLSLLLVLAAVLFNAGLAVINAHIMPLSSGAVIAAEVMIVATAHAVIFANYRAQMLPWYVMIVVIIVFSLARGIAVGSFDPKFLRDALLIATFVLLGMTITPRRLTPLILTLHAIIVVGVLFEAFLPDAFSWLFDIRGYYIATRDFDASNFWNSSSDLFVSATRPGDRFFSFVDFHRLSSVLLEPVSLGNYVVVITAFVCANWAYLSRRVIVFLSLGSLIALIGCDGRFAAVSAGIIVFVTLLAPVLPRKAPLLYLPVVFLCAVTFVVAINPDATQDNFAGRLAYGVQLLDDYEPSDWLGLSNRMINSALDSGIAYAIATQSVVGLIAFWYFLVLSAKEQTSRQVLYLHSLCTYLALSMLVSYSLFSIKTAALLWFIHGAFQIDPAPRRADRPSRAPARGNLYPSAAPSLSWR